MDLIRWASLISDVEEEAADTIGTMYVVLLSGMVVASPSRVESGWHDGRPNVGIPIFLM